MHKVYEDFDITRVGRMQSLLEANGIHYAVNLLGEDHVALGSDFDGAVTTPFDASGIAQITQALISAGLSEAQIRKVMGENSVRFLQQQLPTSERL